MTNIEMINKIKELKELEQYKKEIDSEIESLKDEIKKVYSMILEAHKTLGTSIYSLEL